MPGLLRCARCGKKLPVRYGQTYRYECAGAFNHLAAARCITFGGMRIDRVLAKEVLDRLQPLGVQAALAEIEARSQQRCEKKGQVELPYSKPATRPPARSASMTRPIRKTAWSPVSWSGYGMSA